MSNIVERGTIDPGFSRRLERKRDEVEKRELELDHTLCPRPAWFQLQAFRSSADSNEPIERQGGTSGSKHQEEAHNSNKRVTAVNDEEVPLVNRYEANESGDATRSCEKSDGEKKRSDQRDPEERFRPAIALGHEAKEVNAWA